MNSIKISETEISEINLSKFNNVQDINLITFSDNMGKEHYKLLAYLSTQFNNQNIINIKSKPDSSAVALSFNETNTVSCFDILGNNNIASIHKNIHFYKFNIVEEKNEEVWKKMLLSSPLILINIEPFDGNTQFELYKYFMNNNYKGILIFDNIWVYPEMRNNFWYKIPKENKIDLTLVGHETGTGLIYKDHKIDYVDYNNDNWTLISAYFDLTKMSDASVDINKRSESYYFNHSIGTLNMDVNMVIFCEKENVDKFKQIRPSHLKTKYYICKFEDFYMFKHKSKIAENRKMKPYMFDNRNTPSYYLLCLVKYEMLRIAMKDNIFNSTHFGWFNLCMEKQGYKNLVHINENLALNRDKFSACYIDHVSRKIVENTAEYFLYGRCSFSSGFFTGNKEYMTKFCDYMEDEFLDLLNKGYGHADEQIYSIIYFKHPEIFEFFIGDYDCMVTDYAFVYDKPSEPLRNLITNSYKNEDFDTCFKACSIFWNSYKKKKFKLDKNLLLYFIKMFLISTTKINVHIDNKDLAELYSYL